MSRRVRVLLVQLAKAGDCLFVTTIARQIKQVDYPGCHLTWLIGSPYRSVIEGNPFVDEIIEVPILDRSAIQQERDRIPQHISQLKQFTTFDNVFVTDYTSEKAASWFGTTRSCFFREYPHNVTVNVEPVLSLTQEEVDRVREFARAHSIPGDRGVILFECSPQSGQSQMTTARAIHITNDLIRLFPGLKVILSSGAKIGIDHPDIIDGSKLSFRENAELTKYCTLLVGCSSGISWLNTSTGGARVPMIQNVDPRYLNGRFTASMDIDFKYFGISTNHLIELANASNEEMIECISTVIRHGFNKARRRFHARHRAYYGGRPFLLEVLKRGSYRRGNIQNLKLLVFLLQCELRRMMPIRSLIRRLKWLRGASST